MRLTMDTVGEMIKQDNQPQIAIVWVSHAPVAISKLLLPTRCIKLQRLWGKRRHVGMPNPLYLNTANRQLRYWTNQLNIFSNLTMNKQMPKPENTSAGTRGSVS